MARALIKAEADEFGLFRFPALGRGTCLHELQGVLVQFIKLVREHVVDSRDLKQL